METCLDPLTLDPQVCPSIPPSAGFEAMDPNVFSLQPSVVAISAADLVLVCLAVAVRIYTKFFLLEKLQTEDCKFLR